MLPAYIPDSDDVALICDPGNPDVLKVELRNKAVYCLTQAATESCSRLLQTNSEVFQLYPDWLPECFSWSFIYTVCDEFKDYVDIAVELCQRLLPLPARGEGIEFGNLAEVYLDIYGDLVLEPCFQLCITSFLVRIDVAKYTHGIIPWRDSLYLTSFWTICEAFPYHRNFLVRLVTALEDDAATKSSRNHDYSWLSPPIPSQITERLTLLNKVLEE